jgi:CheY-like chemotaxis protein
VDAPAVDLAEVVRDTEPMLRGSIGAHIDFRCMASAELPHTVIDPNQVSQVLVNLAVNARDAMPGGGRLTIEAMRVGDAGEAVRLVVADTGVGMTEEVAAKAFDPFFTTKAPGSGTGLGLATVYGIVTQAGGTIELDSAPGRGTRVVIELPAAQDEIAAVPVLVEDPPAAGAGSGETILVAEDNDQVRRLACRILRTNGYLVLEAPGGERALQVAAQSPRKIDLLLSDVVMPGMGGLELAARLQRELPGLPVLHMSGYTSMPQASAAPAELIEKPFTAAELLARVRSLLGDTELSAVRAG